MSNRALLEKPARFWNRLVDETRIGLGAFSMLLGRQRLASEEVLIRQLIGGWKTVGHFLEYKARSLNHALLFKEDERLDYVARVWERYPASAREIIESAESICQHQFKFLGRNVSFLSRIDWDFDPDSELRWPKDHYVRIDRKLWSSANTMDPKLTWELNRHQHFLTLGKAYWLTGDNRYADEFSEQVIDWINSTPHGLGINWYSSLEIAIRLISWGLAFQFFRASQPFLDNCGILFVKSIWQQTTFLRDHLTLDLEVRNNHLIGEATAMVLVGTLFPEFNQASEWIDTGIRILEKELRLQTSADGANREQSTAYHRFVVDFLLLTVILARRGAIPESPLLENLLEGMLDYLMYTISPDGRSPMIGDADDGRGFLLSRSGNHWDFREWLAVGAVLFDRPDMKFVAKNFGEESFWLLGPSGLEKFDEIDASPPRSTSRSFPQAGHYVIRDDWTEESDFAFFKCGEFGLGGEGYSAHSHCDQLSLILNIKGISVLVDSGTYSYRGPWRHLFRETRAHNTFVVDGHQQAIPRDAFRWRNVTSAECVSWTGSSVAGAMKVAHNVASRRLVRHPGPGEWELSDLFTGGGTHQISWYFHFSPTLCLSSMGSSITVFELNTGSSVLTLTPPKAVHASLRHYWQSTTYGRKELGLCLVATWEGEILSTGKEFIWGFSAL